MLELSPNAPPKAPVAHCERADLAASLLVGTPCVIFKLRQPVGVVVAVRASGLAFKLRQSHEPEILDREVPVPQLRGSARPKGVPGPYRQTLPRAV